MPRPLIIVAVAGGIAVSVGGMPSASASSVIGRMAIEGQLPDLFFTAGQAATKTISYTYRNIGQGWDCNGIEARSTMSGVAVVSTYGIKDIVTYPPNYAAVGPAPDSIVGSETTWTLKVAVQATAPSGTGVIEIVTLKNSDVQAPNRVLIGTVRVHVRASPFNATFVQTATSGSLYSMPNFPGTGNATVINHPFLNGNPNAHILVTPNWNPGGSGGVYNNHAIGVHYVGFYSAGTSLRWVIYNEDGAAMPVGSSYNVRIEGNADTGALVCKSTTQNVYANVVYIDSPISNNNPDAVLLVTHNRTAPGTTPAVHNHNIGAWYDAPNGRWAIFNQDGAAMATGVAFNVRIFGYSGQSGNGVFFTYGAVSGNSTFIDNSATNARPSAMLLATPVIRAVPAGSYDNHPTGVWYRSASARWAIFNEDYVTMPSSATFNVFVPMSPAP